MKRFWICCGILAALFTASLANMWYVETISARIRDGLEQAEQAVAEGNWDEARALTESAQAYWLSHEDYLAITLSLCDTDDVSTGFEEVLGFLEWEAAAEYNGANGTLLAYVEHLSEIEQITLSNLL